ncbi:MAG TPA: ribosome maturation factor RimM [Candidatus Acidoferrales bacterium]
MSAREASGQPQFLTVAHIVRVRGLRGEVAAEILTDFPERLIQRGDVFLSRGGSAPRRVSVVRAWLATSHGGQIIFQFEGYDTREAAQRLVGLEVMIPYEQRAKLGGGQYYLGDLIGCEVWERKKEVEEVKEVKDKTVAPSGSRDSRDPSFTSSTSFTSLGVVRDVRLDTGTPLLVVDTSQGELLIPLAEGICTRIDPAARRIEVALPEGLRDLNA